MSRIAAWTAVGISLIVATQGAFLVFLGFDERNFADAAGIDWQSFAMAEDIDGRLIGVTALGPALMFVALVRRAMMGGVPAERWILWILPAVLVGWAIVLLPTANASIAAGSLVVAVLLGGALWLAGPVLAGSEPAREQW